ncbi:MAG: 16S rRNA (guanine(527)-N(7))-methyltransferase RsmG [Bdellovibrionales bacterium]|nr:16S rRNA (guanine(527)-N(7))-methyltransferase RsmG [Bdellovibrionales bacterium]
MDSTSTNPVTLYTQYAVQLDQFSELLVRSNKKVNLVSSSELGNLKAHVLDSLLLAPYLETEDSVLDLGSGGGFPVVPLAIASPSVSFTAIDSSERKVDFLSYISSKLRLRNLTAIHGRIEEQSSLHQTFTCVTARALAPLPELIPLAFPFLKTAPSSRLLFLKGENYESEVLSSTDVANELGLSSSKPSVYTDIPGRSMSAILRYTSSR